MKLKSFFIPPVFLFLTLVLIITFYFILPAFNVIPFPYNLTGLVVSFSGFSIMGKAYELFRKHKTTLYIGESSSLMTEGVFSKTRNPMYLGMVILLLGIGICFMNVFSIAAPFVFWLYLTLIVIPKEEILMQKGFGEKYLNYKKSVRRWI